MNAAAAGGRGMDDDELSLSVGSGGGRWRRSNMEGLGRVGWHDGEGGGQNDMTARSPLVVGGGGGRRRQCWCGSSRKGLGEGGEVRRGW
jgi:hypothetical protein